LTFDPSAAPAPTKEHPLNVSNWKFRRMACIAATIAGLAGGAAATFAQQAQPPADVKKFGPRVNQPGDRPKPEVVGNFGDWNIQCEDTTVKSADGKDAAKRVCGMVQSVQDEKRKAIGVTIILRKETQNDKTLTMMQVIAPVGVYLPLGVALEVDSAAVGRVPFTRCAPQLCIAVAEASAPTLEKLKKGTTANFIIYEAPGIGLPLGISLNGFSAAYDELDKYK
jgi:invasion protein IalB